MDALSELDCRLYVDAGESPENLASHLARALSGVTTRGPKAWTVRTGVGEVEIRHNKEADAGRAWEFPDGFLHFRQTLEFYPLPQSTREERVALISHILNLLWSQDLPAVAASDYEGELPHGGGYKSTAIPWPSRNLRRPVATP
jgi:hypothetical protein